MKAFLLPVTIFTVLGFTSVLQAQHRHSHADIFEVTGRIDADVRARKLDDREALHQKALLLRNPAAMKAAYRPKAGTMFKCGTPLIVELEAARAKNLLLPETEVLLASNGNTALPETRATFLSASGKFEFTYFTTGTNAVPSFDTNNNGTPDYVEWAAFAADSSWRHMVARQKYLDPVLQGQTFKFTFIASTQFYGVTYPSGSTTRIEVHKDFVDFPGNTHPEGQQKGALLATVGHELKHSIQYMYDGWDKDSGQFLEMDATLYEDVNFDNVNDYYNYLGSSSSILRNPNASMYGATYYHATWALFFYEKYGLTFWPSVWTRIGNSNNLFLNLINAEVNARGGNMLSDLIENHLHHLAVGDTVTAANARSLRSFGFEERTFYPVFTTAMTTINSAASGQSSPQAINGLAARHILVRPSATDTGNVYLSLNYNKPQTGMGVVVERLDRSNRMYQLPARVGGSFVEVRLPERWENIRRVMAVVVNSDISTTTATVTTNAVTVQYEINNKSQIPVSDERPAKTWDFSLDQNFPNPFNPATTLRFAVPAAQTVRLDVFDLNGRLVATPLNRFTSAGSHEVRFDASGLSSGTYIYRLSSGTGTLVRRMTLIK
jgi:hypothetical protein